MDDCRINPATNERRVALERRRRVSEMSREEMEQELLTSDVTGLPNRRAFEEAGVAQAGAMCDIDGLKAVNDYGYETGNALLRMMAAALREAGLEAYHDKGDEFLCRGNRIEELEVKLERAKAILGSFAILAHRSDGSTVSVTGAAFTYGVGKDIEAAERDLKHHKAHREKRGEIARGELRNIIVKVQKAHPDPLDL